MKQLKSDDVKKFTLEVIGKLNINLTDPENEFKVFNSEIGRYAAQSKITASEFFIARTLLSRGMLTDVDGVILKPYKKIDFEMFNVVEEAYLRFKREDKQYENGKNQLKLFLNPPPPEPTPEQKAEQMKQLIERVKKCVAEFGVCEFAFLVYDEFSKKDDFQELRKTFPEVYDRQFQKWVAKHREKLTMFSKMDITIKEKKHEEIMALLKAGKGIKKSEMEGAPYQLTKNILIEKYLKKDRITD